MGYHCSDYGTYVPFFQNIFLEHT